VSSQNGQTPQPSTLEQLTETRHQVQLLRARRQLATLQRQRTLLEAAAAFDWMGGYQDLIDRFRTADNQVFNPISTAQDRRYGANWPFWKTWQDHARLRGSARILHGLNTQAQGAISGLTSYVIGDGHKYHAQAKKGEDPPAALVGAVQDLIDEFGDRVEMPGLEQEIFERDRVDGESFPRFFDEPDEPGRLAVRIVDPSQVIQPAGDLDEVSFGVLTRRDDVEGVVGYAVSYDGNSSDFETVPAREMLHFKANVPRAVKRGLTDLCFDTYDALKTAGRLLQNMGEGGAIQAAIAMIRQHETALADAAQGFVDAQADYDAQNPFTGSTVATRQFTSGTIEDIPGGLSYVVPPWTQNVPGFVQLGGLLLRSVAVKWNAPEWLVSGDASNNNYASSITAESPFVKTCSRRQSFYRGRFVKIMWRVVRHWCAAHGGLYAGGRKWTFEEIRRLIDIQAVSPDIQPRNTLQKAQEDSTYSQLGAKSVQTICGELGLDYEEQVQQIEEHQERTGGQGQALGMPGGGMGGEPQPGGEPQTDGDFGFGGPEMGEAIMEAAAAAAGFTGTITLPNGGKRTYANGKEVKGTPDTPAAGDAGGETPAATAAQPAAQVKSRMARLLGAAKRLPGKVKAKAVEFVKAKYARFEERYGPAGAKALMAGVVLTLPLPGNVLACAAVAEGIKAVVGVVRGKGKAAPQPATEAVGPPLDQMVADAADFIREAMEQFGGKGEIDEDKLREALLKLTAAGETQESRRVLESGFTGTTAPDSLGRVYHYVNGKRVKTVHPDGRVEQHEPGAADVPQQKPPSDMRAVVAHEDELDSSEVRTLNFYDDIFDESDPADVTPEMLADNNTDLQDDLNNEYQLIFHDGRFEVWHQDEIEHEYGAGAISRKNPRTGEWETGQQEDFDDEDRESARPLALAHVDTLNGPMYERHPEDAVEDAEIMNQELKDAGNPFRVTQDEDSGEWVLADEDGFPIEESAEGRRFELFLLEGGFTGEKRSKPSTRFPKGQRMCYADGKRVACPKQAKPAKPVKPTIDDVHAHLQGYLDDPSKITPEVIADAAHHLSRLSKDDLTELKKRVGARASGTKAVLAEKIARHVLGPKKEKPAPKAKREPKPKVAPKPRAAPAKGAAGVSPEKAKASVLSAFDALDKGDNFVPLGDLRKSMADAGITDRAAQDKLLLAMRGTELTFSPIEGRHGASDEDLAAAIKDSDGTPLGFVSRRGVQPKAAAKPSPAAAKAEPKTPAAPVTPRPEGRRFVSGKEAGAWARDAFGGWAGKLSEPQRAALAAYANEDEGEGAGGYLAMNAVLRHGDGAKDPYWGRSLAEDGRRLLAQHQAHLDTAIASSTVPEDVVVHRGIGEHAAELVRRLDAGELVPGSTITDHGYVSTSLSEETAAEIGGKRGVHVEIRVPKGAHAAYVDGAVKKPQDESEMMLPRGSRFRIVSAGKDAAGKRKMVVELLPPEQTRESRVREAREADAERSQPSRYAWSDGDIEITPPVTPPEES
jgi:hypothetical protein